MDGFNDDTAQRNSCTLLDCDSTYSIMDCPRLILAESSPRACTVWQSTLLRLLRKESKIEREVSVAVNMHSLIVSKIDQILSNPCQVRSELPTKSLERV